MKERLIYDRFPARIILMRYIILTMFFGTGAVSIYIFNPPGLVIYVAYTFTVAGIIMGAACTRCDYYGSVCDLGTSVLVSKLFKQKPEKEKFTCIAQQSIPWLIPIILLPLAAGIYNIIAVVSIMNIVFLTGYLTAVLLFAVTSVKITCPRCKMYEKCPFAGNGVKAA